MINGFWLNLNIKDIGIHSAETNLDTRIIQQTVDNLIKTIEFRQTEKNVCFKLPVVDNKIKSTNKFPAGWFWSKSDPTSTWSVLDYSEVKPIINWSNSKPVVSLTI